jgi:hypothetical protein
MPLKNDEAPEGPGALLTETETGVSVIETLMSLTWSPHRSAR